MGISLNGNWQDFRINLQTTLLFAYLLWNSQKPETGLPLQWNDRFWKSCNLNQIYKKFIGFICYSQIMMTLRIGPKYQQNH